MRMEELKDNNYIKSTDSVERYLLNIVEEYFDSMKITDTNSREYIIQKAVERMKEEILIDNAGVLSVNGLTGEVTITLEDLNGEPKIEIKHSAFNVDFGDKEGTACEGNDPRLSDARTPLAHTHTVSEIIGLDGVLSSIEASSGKIEDYKHEHHNKTILDKITYSGDKAIIDLFFLDSVDEKITEIETIVNNTVTPLPELVDTTNQNVLTTIAETKVEINNFINETVEKVDQINTTNKETIESKYQEIRDELSSLISGQISLDDINYIVSTLNKTPTLVVSGQTTIQDFSEEYKEQEEMVNTTEDLKNIDMEFEAVIVQNDGTEIISPIPYHHVVDGAVSSIVNAFVSGTNLITWQIINNGTPITSLVTSVTIRFRGYNFPQLSML